nr:hypothetical protein BaRGS_007846 [Batillaria attramentaria]
MTATELNSLYTMLDKIKEQARYIADLPDDDFNDLVVNARDFSLARGRHPLPHSTAMSSSSQHTIITVPDDCSEEEDEACCRDGQPLGASVPPLLLNTSPMQKGSGAAMTDDDSGLPSSTMTGRRNSYSDDTDTSDMEGKGVFDYIPTTRVKREAVSIHHTYNPHYDEEIAVESDKSSVESPRSDTSSTREYDVTPLDSEDLAAGVGGGATEMTTYSLESHGYNDEDSDDNIHRRLYGRSVGSSTSSGAWESIERPRASSTSSINFSRSQPLLSQGQTISSLRSTNASALGRSVDDGVHFPSLSRYSSDSRYSPESRYSPDSIGALPRPPFSPDEDLLRKVGNSVSQLVSTSYNLSQPSCGDGLTDGKKKKKKKKDGKGW